jgi:exodeoxyribonuclease VII small subunit
LFENPLGAAQARRPVEDKDSQLPFEAALTRLETLVDSMESGDIPLAELLSKFQEGNNLLKICETRLKDAELRIEQLKKDRDEAVFIPFEAPRETT